MEKSWKSTLISVVNLKQIIQMWWNLCPAAHYQIWCFYPYHWEQSVQLNYTIPWLIFKLIQVKQVCWPMKHGTIRALVLLCWKMNSASAGGSMNTACIESVPQTDISRWHGTENHHWPLKRYSGLQDTGILRLATLPLDPGSLNPKRRDGY